MNHIYRVIFNHATSAFTAVSELTKNKNKSSKTIAQPVIASTRFLQGKKSLYVAIATAIGLTGASMQTQAVTFGTGNTDSATGIAGGIGNQATANTTSALGSQNKATERNATSIGRTNTAEGQGASAVGYNNTASGQFSSTTGYNNAASKDYSSATGAKNTASGKGSTATGYNNTASANNSSATGYQNKASGNSSSATGYQNKASGGGSLATGFKNNASGGGSSAAGYSNTASGRGSLAAGYNNTASGNSSLAAGASNTASNTLSAAVGTGNEASGAAAIALGAGGAGKRVPVAGQMVNPSFTAATGSVLTEADGRNYKDNSGTKVYEYQNYEAAASGAKATETYALALGSGTVADKRDGVALGSSSKTTTDKGVAGYDPSTGAASTNTSSTWAATHAAVAVGNDSTVTRQITGVAAGKEETDAVNVAQLKAVVDGKVTFAANTGTNITRKLGQTLNIKGGTTTTDTNASADNITVTASGTDTLTVKLANAPVFTGQVTAQGVSAGGQKVVNVANATLNATSADAVTGQQLFSTNQNVSQHATALGGVATALGGGASFTGGTFTAPTYTLKGANYNNVGDALTSLDGRVTTLEGSGVAGKSAYEVAKDNGFTGTQTEWLASLKGEKGEAGAAGVAGAQGPKGETGATGAQGPKGETGATGAQGLKGETGQAGKDGTDGKDGASAYEIAKRNGFTGTEAEFAQTSTTHFFSVNKDGADKDKGNFKNDGATGQNAIAIGVDASASGKNAISIGTGNQVTGENSGAIGDPSSISGSASYSLGNDNTISANNSFAVGNNIKITQGNDNAVALGYNTQVSASNAVALGAGSVADEADTVSVGSKSNERRVTNVAAGKNDTDAVNVSQLNSLGYQINQQNKKIDQQGAMSAAMVNMAASVAGINRRNRVAVGAGYQNGEKAVSVGYQRAVKDDTTLTFSGAFTEDDTAVGAGLGFGW